MEKTKPRQFKPDHIVRFEKHLTQIELSKTDPFVIDSIKLTFFAGWAAAMDSISENWFQPKADNVKEELQGAVDRLHALELGRQQDVTQGISGTFALDLSDFDEKVQTSYLNFKVD
jgi:hypothetical protein